MPCQHHLSASLMVLPVIGGAVVSLSLRRARHPSISYSWLFCIPYFFTTWLKCPFIILFKAFHLHFHLSRVWSSFQWYSQHGIFATILITIRHERFMNKHGKLLQNAQNMNLLTISLIITISSSENAAPRIPFKTIWNARKVKINAESLEKIQ